jgi:hypothetical protein
LLDEILQVPQDVNRGEPMVNARPKEIRPAFWMNPKFDPKGAAPPISRSRWS